MATQIPWDVTVNNTSHSFASVFLSVRSRMKYPTRCKKPKTFRYVKEVSYERRTNI